MLHAKFQDHRTTVSRAWRPFGLCDLNHFYYIQSHEIQENIDEI